MIWRSLLLVAIAVSPVAGVVRVSLAAEPTAPGQPYRWSEEEKKVLQSLTLSSLPPLPPDPSNAYADRAEAIALGKKLFFDKRFSANGRVSCATCHLPEYSFTDRLPLARGMGTTTRRTMPLIGVAYQAWFFWDGRKDSLWSQAIGPIESAVEHGVTRSFCAHLISDQYKGDYEEIFGRLPTVTHKRCPPKASPGTGNPAALKLWNAMRPEDRDTVNRIYVNIGKAIAAYVRRIVPSPARFDRYADAVFRDDHSSADAVFEREEEEGLRLFIGKAKCTNCHSGPLFTNGEFHDVGLNDSQDRGRAEGIGNVLIDEFNCMGKYSDATQEECREIRFIDRDKSKYIGAFKTPTLRNVTDRPPYMHAGRFKDLKEVLLSYRGSSSDEAEHQNLTSDELSKIEAFLKTLSGPLTSP